jgi:hypothetical protein
MDVRDPARHVRDMLKPLEQTGIDKFETRQQGAGVTRSV